MPDTIHRKTLIFDLDETLVHCIDPVDHQTFDLPIKVTFPSGQIVMAGVNIRPYAY